MRDLDPPRRQEVVSVPSRREEELSAPVSSRKLAVFVTSSERTVEEESTCFRGTSHVLSLAEHIMYNISSNF